MIAEALVNEADISRVHPGAAATFWPENGERPIPMVVDTISPGALATLDAPEQASIHGGAVPVRREADGHLKPETALYRVVLRVADTAEPPPAIRRGMAHIAGDRISLAASVWRRAASVVMREAGL